MMHWNFGDFGNGFSIGCEGAGWGFIRGAVPVSLDLGFEYEFGYRRWRFYSEAQTVCFSAGPVIEITAGERIKAGFQGSLWYCAFAGIDVRYRRIGGENIICPGVFGKAPIYPSLGYFIRQMQ
jgi:hypothetical protein